MEKRDSCVKELVGKVLSGELRLPEMQRRYVWTAPRVRDLLDSLYRGYPSGAILVWETDGDAPIRDISVERAAGGTSKPSLLLLDGQQRLTSLTAVIEGKPIQVRDKKRPIEILFNLDHPEGGPAEVVEVDDEPADPEDEQVDDEDEDNVVLERQRKRTFVVYSRALEGDPLWIKVSDIFTKTDGQLLRGVVKDLDDPNYDKYSNRLQRVRAIRDYPYVMHVLDKKLSYEEVAEIFVRVNSLGVKLRGSDLALAQITSRWHNSLKLFEQFQEECEKYWYTLDLGLLVRTLVTFATGQSRFKVVASLRVDDMKDAWERAKRGLQFAINFLRVNCGVEDESLLSSPLFLITLAWLGEKQGYEFSASDHRVLKRWLFIANARGHYTKGSSESIHDVDLKLISEGRGPAGLMERLKEHVTRFEIEPSDLVGRGQRSSLLAMAYLALRAQGAMDWRTGLGLSLTTLGKYHFIQHHHVFPKAVLRDAKFTYETAEINEIANMAFVGGGTNRKIAATKPEEYLAQVVGNRGDDALSKHCIPLNPELWKVENYREFLNYRRAGLAKAINEFIDHEAEPNVDDAAALIASGETDTVEFKSSLRWGYKDEKPLPDQLQMAVLKEIFGFLNANGGTLFIGVSDDGLPLGLEKDYGTFEKSPDRDGFYRHLTQLVINATGKDLASSLRITFPAVGQTEVCRIDVPQAEAPVLFVSGDKQLMYVRIGATVQTLSPQDMLDYVSKHWHS